MQIQSQPSSRVRARVRVAYARRARQVLIALLFSAWLLPSIVLVLHAFTTRWFYPQLWPAEWTGAPFMRQLTNPQTRQALTNSLLVAGVVTARSLLIALPAARTLGLRQFRGKELVLLLLGLPAIIPPIATGMGMNILFLRLGLGGSLPGVVLAHLVPVLPYTVFALTAVFARYDSGYEQQAATLGASPLRVLFRVTLPLIAPGLAVAALFAFLVSWNQYVLTLLIGGGRVITLPVLLFSVISGGNVTSIAILSLLFAALPMVAISLTAGALTDQSPVTG